MTDRLGARPTTTAARKGTSGRHGTVNVPDDYSTPKPPTSHALTEADFAEFNGSTRRADSKPTTKGACRECGKWLPGERSLCGRCYARST